MLRLPQQNSPLRKLFSIDDLLADRFPTFREAKLSAQKMFKSDPAIKAVNIILQRANGEIWLVKFGPKSGWKKIWNFGKNK
ncbi:MAG: hypothetical protein GXO75_15325 [Calditrichaeota bacterium]|nr:hypothetical protein [Calditrichota bacterium]